MSYRHTHQLTRVYPLQLDVFLQLSPEALLATMFSQSSIIHQQEMGVETIKTSPLAQGVSQRLVGPEYLNHTKGQENQETRTIYEHTKTC